MQPVQRRQEAEDGEHDQSAASTDATTSIGCSVQPRRPAPPRRPPTGGARPSPPRAGPPQRVAERQRRAGQREQRVRRREDQPGHQAGRRDDASTETTRTTSTPNALTTSSRPRATGASSQPRSVPWAARRPARRRSPSPRRAAAAASAHHRAQRSAARSALLAADESGAPPPSRRAAAASTGAVADQVEADADDHRERGEQGQHDQRARTPEDPAQLGRSSRGQRRPCRWPCGARVPAAVDGGHRAPFLDRARRPGPRRRA